MRRRLLVLLVVATIGIPLAVTHPSAPLKLSFPNGKRFAFSIVDDTDMATLARLEPIYALLHKYGLRTTKTVWVYDSSDQTNPANQGDSLQNPAYRRFILGLQSQGFEIALHGVRGGSSRREDVLRGLEDFKAIVGQYPSMYVNHSTNAENIYWGRHLYSFAPYRWLGGAFFSHEFSGEDVSSPYFWGDAAQRHIRYVRRFTFEEPNLLAVSRSIPYRLTAMPYVNYWFPTANGNRIVEFDELLKPENIARLEREGGVCLVYSHLGSGSYNKPNGVDPRFEERLRQLTSHNGWFAPASEILDYLRQQPGWTGELSFRERLRMDTRFAAAHFTGRN